MASFQQDKQNYKVNIIFKNKTFTKNFLLNKIIPKLIKFSVLVAECQQFFHSGHDTLNVVLFLYYIKTV